MSAHQWIMCVSYHVSFFISNCRLSLLLLPILKKSAGHLVLMAIQDYRIGTEKYDAIAVR